MVYNVQQTITAFWCRVEKTDTCWLWTGGRTKDGYANFRFDSKDSYGHAFAFLLHTGHPVPEGLVIDHLCRVRHCVRPDHLRAVTQMENVNAGLTKHKYCKRGHPLADPNYYYWKANGVTKKRCKACIPIQMADYNARKKNA